MTGDPAVDDLREVVRLGLARGGELLTAGEALIARRIEALDGETAALYARLSKRSKSCFHLPSLTVRGITDPIAGCAALCEAGLADGLVPWKERLRHLPRPRLVEACRAWSLATSGLKADLVQRLESHTDPFGDRWIRIRHRELVARLERWAFLRPWPDPATPILERLGLIRWPTYPLTPGSGLYPDRRSLLAWEALLAAPMTADLALEALRTGTGRATAGLDLRRTLVRVVRHEAHAHERAGDPARAASLYRALADEGFERRGKIAVRHARAEEVAGRPTEALAVLRAAQNEARPSEQVAIARAGRRLARAVRSGFPPAIPLVAPRVRSLRLDPAGSAGGRPLWRSSQGPRPVEDAVRAVLSDLGRRAVRAEGAPWSTLVAVLCAELWFLPVAGALPVRFLAGPLDLGTPAFRAARRDAVEALLSAVDRGEAPDRIRVADPIWRGIRLAGARWDETDAETLACLAEGIGPTGLRVVVETLLDHGPRAAAGLPDLVLLPGEPVQIADAHPSKVPQHLVFIEVKGPGDSVRDEQCVWHDRLARAGVPVELWEVGPPPGHGQTEAGLR